MITFKQFLNEKKKLKKQGPLKSANFKLPADQDNEYSNHNWTPESGDNRVVGESYITNNLIK